MTILWIITTFSLSAIPFSLLIGRYILDVDIREYGDGNPGATNVLRAGGKLWGGIALCLDVCKAMIPVGIAYFYGSLPLNEMTLIAIAAVAGHAYSPFLRFRGGKAVAVTFGMWIGLTLWEVPTFLGVLLLFWFKSVNISGWAVVLAMLSLFFYLILRGVHPIFLGIWFGNFLILITKHIEDLKQLPDIHIWLPIKRYQHQSSS